MDSDDEIMSGRSSQEEAFGDVQESDGGSLGGFFPPHHNGSDRHLVFCRN